MADDMTAARRKSDGLSRAILKVMALFSGLQIFGILCSIVKMKFVALWLSADGVGLFGIFNSTIETTTTLTDMGLRQSSVRDIAINRNSPGRLAVIVAVVRRWCRYSGMLGAVVLSALAWPLSQWFFGEPSHWWQFTIAGGCLIFNSMINGEQAIMQGSGMLRQLARSSLAASIAGVVLSIPMFYFMGEVSVIWSIAAYTMSGLVAAAWYGWKGPKANVTRSHTITEGKSFVKLGIFMSLAAFAANLANMAFLAWLAHSSDTAEVGNYQAGTTLVIRYVGLVFTAIGVEFYPRLAANIFSSRRTSLFVNHEIKLVLLIITPVALMFILLRKWIVVLLYSPEFHTILPFISWAVVSCIFKGASWCMAYTMLARGDGKIYILTEITDAIIGLLLCIGGYQLLGLEGVGLAYIAWYMIYTIIAGIVYRFRYKLELRTSTLMLTIASAAAVTMAVILCRHTAWIVQAALLLPASALCIIPLARLWSHRRTR